MEPQEFEESMYDASQVYFDLLEKKEETEILIERMREVMQKTLRLANRDTYDHPNSPVVVTFKMKRTAERMKRGGKDMLRGMLTPVQWRTVYSEPGEKAALTVKRRDKMRD